LLRRSFERCDHPGGDRFQRYYVRLLLALTLYIRGENAAAAMHWLESLHESAAIRNRRGTAGAVEGSAYLACEHGRHELATRLLGAAARGRDLTGAPLFGHWRAHHQRVRERCVAALGEARIAERFEDGRAARNERTAQEAAEWLAELVAGGAASRAAEKALRE
jgi:hypothetical protein